MTNPITNPAQLLMSVLNRILRKMFFALAVTCTLTSIGLNRGQAQTFSVLHYFTGGADGANPYADVTVASAGVLYGTASGGGSSDNGTVFKLRQVNSSWVFSPLYEFTGGSDGGNPYGGVVVGPNGALYGTTHDGDLNYGTVFELRPPATFCRSILCYWNIAVLHTFLGAPDGEYPVYENLAFDNAGDIYGTTIFGGIYSDIYGTVFELTPSGGGYTESVLHSFGSGQDGEGPFGGVVLDTAGNVYGTTQGGGTGGGGTLYQLMPSNGAWLENILVNFAFLGPNGTAPRTNLIIDEFGNLYGTTASGTQNGVGVVFKLAPSNGGFTYSVLYAFSSMCDSNSGLTMDATGNFFGACSGGGANQDGWIFELTNCSQTCTLVDLHDFSGSDGADPWGGPVLDANGNLYGTASLGGNTATICEFGGCGVVWEIAGVGAPHKN